MKLISLKICPFVQRVAALLAAKNINYDIEYIGFDHTPDWFLEISPNAQVPVLVTDSGRALFESEAIMEYLDEVYPPLEPDLSPEQRAIDRAWGYQASNIYLTQCSSMRSINSELLAENTKKLGKVFAKVENQLGEGPYFKGDFISNLDVAWLPLLHRAAIIKAHTDYDFVAGFPKVQAWQSAILESGLVEKTVSEDFEGIFTGFYLSDATYLGSGVERTAFSNASGSSCG